MATELIKKENGFPVGHVCRKCGKRWAWASYVFAHFHDDIIHTCECGCKTLLQYGEAEDYDTLNQ